MERRAKRKPSQLFSGEREQKRQFLFSGTVVRSWGRNTRSFLQDSISKTLGAAGYNDCSEIPHHRPQLRAPLFSWKLCLGSTPPHSTPSPSGSQASGSSSPGAVQDQAYRVFKLPCGEQSLEFSGFPVSWLGAGDVTWECFTQYTWSFILIQLELAHRICRESWCRDTESSYPPHSVCCKNSIKIHK